MKIIKRLPGLPVERALGVLSGRWKAVLLDVLSDGPQRTCDLEKRIAGITQKVLIEQLRALEEHGMVSRQPRAGDSQAIICSLRSARACGRYWTLSLNGEPITPENSMRPIGFCHAVLSFEIAVPDASPGYRRAKVLDASVVT